MPDLYVIALDYLGRFDAGIAPTIADVVDHCLAVDSSLTGREVRQTVVTLVDSGRVASRWDNGAYVYWAVR